MVVPLLLELVGVSRPQLNAVGVAVVHLALDVLQLFFTRVIFRVALRKYRPREFGLFRFSFN